jgi:UDP-N-acetylglucosamine--N-acetylmuramyl-(pentapeptide) pyrophosphoryl-undecaprenol N-acetylglucosamine transferase
MSTGPIMIMAGGTGGHIFPGLAVAETLRARECEVVWVGTRRGLEARLVPEHGFEIEWIKMRGVRRRGVLAWVVTPWQLVTAVFKILAAFRRRKPTAVLGMGGFVSAPGGIAAWLVRKPLIIHEQNAVAGSANRLLAPLAREVYAGFPGAFSARVHHRVIGNPVRAEIEALPAPRERFAARTEATPRVLVLGGSQGARVLNATVPAALALLAPARRPAVRHQAGLGLELARSSYRAAGIDADVFEFIGDMAAAYGWADVVIARAGALTIAELEAAGIGALLVPYPYAVDDHQTKNAEQFARGGAGIVLPEDELDAERLAAALHRVLGDRDALLRMAEAARAQAKPGAAAALADACILASEGVGA